MSIRDRNVIGKGEKKVNMVKKGKKYTKKC